jgi:uncharacterized protein YdaU (DUF1376 family)
MSAVNLWFQYWVKDFALRCSSLTLEEEGAFMRLLRHYWSTQSALPNDDARLARFAGADPKTWQRLRGAIKDLFEIDDNRWRLPWLDEQMEKAKEISAKRSESGRKGGVAKASNREATPKQMLGKRLDIHSHIHNQISAISSREFSGDERESGEFAPVGLEKRGASK